MSTRPAVATADDSMSQHSRAVVLFTGLSYLFVGLGFSYLDRRFGNFALEGFLWLFWAALGFGAGMLHCGRSASAGRVQWIVMGALGMLLALFPGLGIYNLLRWACLTLMIVIGARAAVLKTRRDFHLTLVVIFVVSFAVGTHGYADWTLWLYLGPAWVFGGLSLVWDHAGDAALSRWTKALMALGFITVATLLALVVFFFAPRPSILGFGFLPPGTDAPSMFEQPAGNDGQVGNGGGNGASGVGGSAGQNSASTPEQGGTGQQWDAMLKNLRQAASDKTIPQWQRSLIESALDGAQALHGLITRRPFKRLELTSPRAGSSEMAEQYSRFSIRVDLFLVLMLALMLLMLILISYLLWRCRYRLGLQLVLGSAWLLAGKYSAQSMRLSAQAMKWCLHMQGHPRRRGQSVREHWVGAAGMVPLAHRCLINAVESYCAMRFGNVPATQPQAINMHKAVLDARDIMTAVALKGSR